MKDGDTSRGGKVEDKVEVEGAAEYENREERTDSSGRSGGTVSCWYDSVGVVLSDTGLSVVVVVVAADSGIEAVVGEGGRGDESGVDGDKEDGKGSGEAGVAAVAGVVVMGIGDERG